MFLCSVLSCYSYCLIKGMQKWSATRHIFIWHALTAPPGYRIDFGFFCYRSHDCYFTGNGDEGSESILSESRYKSSRDVPL